MNSTEIKKALAAILPKGVKLSVTTTPTKNPYICARLRPTNLDEAHRRNVPLSYPALLPVQLRRCALAAIYGDDSPLCNQGAAGNVDAVSMAMHAHEWAKTFEFFRAGRFAGLGGAQ